MSKHGKMRVQFQQLQPGQRFWSDSDPNAGPEWEDVEHMRLYIGLDADPEWNAVIVDRRWDGRQARFEPTDIVLIDDSEQVDQKWDENKALSLFEISASGNYSGGSYLIAAVDQDHATVIGSRVVPDDFHWDQSDVRAIKGSITGVKPGHIHSYSHRE